MITLIITLTAAAVVAVASTVVSQRYRKQRQAAYEAFIAKQYASQGLQEPGAYIAEHLDIRALVKIKPVKTENNGPNAIEIQRDVNGATRAIHHVTQPVKAPTNPADINLLKFRQQCMAQDRSSSTSLFSNADGTPNNKDK